MLDDITKQLEIIYTSSSYRRLTSRDRFTSGTIYAEDQSLVSFSCNDYLGLSHHPEVIEASIAATKQYGSGAGGSRFITGNNSLYASIETGLSKLKQTESALVFGSGYLTNIGIIPALIGRHDLILADKLIHRCMLDGAALSKATLKRFKHQDLDHLKQLLQQHRKQFKRCIILTEAVFSMEGDVAPIDAMITIADSFDCLLISDNAHGFAVLPPLTTHPRHIQMGTFSKAIGCYGGYVAATSTIIELLTQKATSLLFSTGLPPGTLGAINCALALLEQNVIDTSIPLAHAHYFTNKMGLPPAQSPIISLMIGNANTALSLAVSAQDKGLLLTAIRPPTVKKGTERLRLTFTAQHQREDIDKLIKHLKDGL